MGKVQKEGRWVLHELTEDNKNRRHDTALTLLSKFGKKDFLYRIITNEKWILYDNPKRRNHELIMVNLRHRRQNPIPRQESFALYLVGLKRYVVLRVVTIMVDRYQQQLTNLSDELEEKRPFTGQGCRKVTCFIIMLNHILRKRLRTISLR